MELSYTSIEGKSRKYYITVAILAAITLAGFASFIISYLNGHQVFGSNNAIPWGLPIVLAIYLIGLSAGLHILAFLIYIMGQERYRSIIKVAVFLAVVLIFGAGEFRSKRRYDALCQLPTVAKSGKEDR